MLSIGRSNYMRFNNPAEAKQLKSVLPNSRISMAPISFSMSPDTGEIHLERKPPVAPRKSPRNSCSDEDVGGFLGKLTKFEMLARQSRNSVSPKVFPVGALTTNVPAEQILGHSRSSSLISLTKSHNSPLQNLTNFDRSRSNTPCHANGQNNHEERDARSDCRTPGKSSTPSNYLTATPNDNQVQMYSASTEGYMRNCSQNCHENNNENIGSQGHGKIQPNGYDLMSRSMICQRASEFDKYGREFDMSQSLIVTKTTTTEFLQLDKFSSNSSNLGSNGYGDTAGRMVTQGFGSSPNIRRIQPPSPAFNRNPKYSEQKRSPRVKSPTPSNGSGCSLEELRERQYEAESKRREAESKRKIAQEERVKEQEVERLEKMRLEEILAMCAEYERQSTLERPRQPNR